MADTEISILALKAAMGEGLAETSVDVHKTMEIPQRIEAPKVSVPQKITAQIMGVFRAS